ncbi:MAG: imidazole glycerol phosphate synthase subunit HisH [Firmicutes bacterium]|nr:imidazole glycerol phosphate synthase subunit HisH [Bacillota bacterium]
MISIIDYGAGNLKSVKNALDYLGADSVITGDANMILAADKVILPGVGAFGAAMDALRSSGLDRVIRETADSGKPLLGICLGLQLMFEESEESPGAEGLGIFKGKIVKIPDTGLKIPHIGWNSITLKKESKILKKENAFVYFVHSYYLKTDDTDIVSASTEYGAELDIAVERGNIFATQFHPEKSGGAGIQILKNFTEL